MSRRRTTIFLIRWHRRLGLSLAVIILILAISGIVLNHTTGLRLSDVRISNELLLRWYGIESQQKKTAFGFEVLPGTWLSAAGDGQLFLNSHLISECQLPLKGAVTQR